MFSQNKSLWACLAGMAAAAMGAIYIEPLLHMVQLMRLAIAKYANTYLLSMTIL